MLTYVEILGGVFGFRLLTRRELREGVEKYEGSPLEFEDYVCDVCVERTPTAFPGFGTCLAGIPSSLCKEIMKSSGYDQDVSPLELEAVQWSATPQARIDTLICFCFPRITLDDLEDMDPRQYYKYAASAQLIMGGMYGMDAGPFLNPGSEKHQRKRRSSKGHREQQPPPGEPPSYLIK